MRYQSTRGGEAVSFEAAIRAGWAPNGIDRVVCCSMSVVCVCVCV